MLNGHPTSEDFESFLRSAHGQGDAQRNARILRHLLADCSSCRQGLRDIGWDERRLDRLFRFPFERQEDYPATAAPYDYSRAFATAEQALNEVFAEGRAGENAPEELLAELAALSPDEQVRLVTSYSRFADPRLFRKLLELINTD